MMDSQGFSNLNLEIAGIKIGLESRDVTAGFSIRDIYRPFITTKKPQLKLAIHFARFPKIGLGKNIFYTSGLDVYSQNGRFVFFYKEIKQPPYLMVITDKAFKNLDLYYRRSYRSFEEIFPLDFPFDAMLLVNLLSQRDGLLVHACGVKIKNKGYLFMGPSGAGKSTIARIINDNQEFCILGDDRITVRKKVDQFFIYGTPWPGQAGFVSNQKARLEKIFFLRHDNTNRIKRLSMQESVLQATGCSFLPLWDRVLLGYALETMDDLIREVPCFSLDFLPDKTVLDLVKPYL